MHLLPPIALIETSVLFTNPPNIATGILGSQSGMSSVPASISGPDGFTIRGYHFPPGSHYPSGQDDDFGFDPPQVKLQCYNSYQVYSPPNDIDMSISGWPEFMRDDDLKPSLETPVNLDGYKMDKFISSTPLNSDTAVSRYGQVTPPRSTSAASANPKSEEKLSPKSQPTERRKRGKAQPKGTDPTLATSTTTTTTTTGRKRKSARRQSIADDGEPADDPKRKQSLEKNRLAAAKCRVNNKEMIDRLQQDSHEKPVENAYFKVQVIRMKDEIQQMKAILAAHVKRRM